MANPAPLDNWLWPSSPVPPVRPATTIEVLRATTGSTSSGGTGFAYQTMANLVCSDVVWRMGSQAKTAVLRYRFDGFTPGVPQSVEQALSTAANSPGTINVGDRIVVRAVRPDGSRVPLFDGFPQEFGLVLDDGVETVAITCVGVEYRLRDLPVGGAVIRDASQPTATSSAAQFPSDLVARCNPGGLANATDTGSDFDPSPGGTADQKYPVFLDLEVCRDRKIGRKWTLAMVARYLIFTNNTDETYVKNPEGSDLDEVLVSQEPKGGRDLRSDGPQDVRCQGYHRLRSSPDRSRLARTARRAHSRQGVRDEL